jgi:hypothetical protein
MSIDAEAITSVDNSTMFGGNSYINADYILDVSVYKKERG